MRFTHLKKPLARVFGAAPPPPSPSAPTLEEQLAALETAAPDVLVATILGTGEDALRTAAVARLDDGDLLRGLAHLNDGAALDAAATLTRAAQERLAHLVDVGTVEVAALRASTPNTAALLSVASLCVDDTALAAVFGSLTDHQEVVTLVTEGSSTRIRQLAAQRIEDPVELQELVKRVRSKDKNVYKIIKQKCDGLRAEEQRITQTATDADAACASLERHAHRIYDAIYVPSLAHFEARWQAVEAQAAPAVRERAQAALALCRDIIAAHERLLAEQADKESRDAARQAAKQQAGLEAVAEAERREEQAALSAVEADKVRAAEAEVRAAAEQARAEALAADALAVRQLGGLLGKANAALKEGNTGRAAGLRQAIEEKMPRLPASGAYLAKQVQQLDEKLIALKQWKDFAVAPKRAELIADIEALIGSAEEPRVLAERIKQLQEDWKTISKGIVVGESEADWQRFHEASEKAYAPCKAYFEALSKQRKDNLDKRRSVLERVLAFETAQNVEHPDWKAVSMVLREARPEFRRYAPVDRGPGHALEAELETALERLSARLDAWYAQNMAEKKALIARAQALLDKEDGRDAVDGVKHLQVLWKEVGPAQRDQEQTLWHEFRAHCDAVFQKREKSFVDYTAGLEASKAQALALCVEAERVAGLNGPELLEGVGKIAQWRADYAALGELPRADARGLYDRFERAVTRCQAQVAQLKARDQAASVGNLFEAARHIAGYGWAIMQGMSEAERDALKAAAEAFIAAVPQWPKGGAAVLKDAWAKAEGAAGIDPAAQEKALRLLCIRSEILGNRDTPPDDQALRRDYQVQRLVKHMGRPHDGIADNVDGLAFEWIRVGPAEPRVYARLLERFRRAR